MLSGFLPVAGCQFQSKPPKAAEPEKLQTAPPPQAAAMVQFRGNRSFSDQELRTALADTLPELQRQGLSLPAADDNAYFLEVFYRRQGFPAVDVQYRIRSNVLELDINEGPYFKLGYIYFEGNRTFQSSDLQQYMVGTTRSRFSQFKQELPFVESDLIQGTSLLQSFYISQGFPQVQIEKLATIPDRRRGAIDAVVTIKEGPRFFFGPIGFVNNIGISAEPFYQKFRALNDPAKPYSDSELQTLQRDLVYIFKRQGYYAATVAVDPDFSHAVRGKVPVRITADPGPLYHFGSVVVDQARNARIRPVFLPRRLASLMGQTYDPKKLQEAYTQLYQTGLFDTLDVQETAEPDDTIQLRLSPREARSKELGFYLGYETFNGVVVGANYRNLNFDGLGHIFSVTAAYTGRGPQGEISYEDPWFLNSDIRFRTALGISSQQLVGYTATRYYGTVAFTKTFRKGVDSGLFFEAKQVSLSSVTINPESLAGPLDYQLATAGITQNIDHRDNPINPRKGWILDGSAAISQSSRGSSSFGRFTGRYSNYVSVGKELVAFGARLGYITPFDTSTDIPINERFFNGGATTVRSFDEFKLGPRDHGGNPIGGIARSVFNVEVDRPIIGDFGIAVFADAGGLGDTPFDHFSSGIGAGIRYFLPIGGIRLDLALNPAPTHDESIGAIHFSFGTAF
ncbi:MAG: BamA/TamA family outer membrane protein [Verrucomicrobia bacterium]|nr:BamA/TamA family outer membrane protein [Verrucomicrobiota bacterium]